MTAVIDHRRQQVREATARYRKRRKYGRRRVPIDVTDAELDNLVARGYLDPSRRSDPFDQCDALELFLIDALAKR
jgi:hypothetical protein